MVLSLCSFNARHRMVLAWATGTHQRARGWGG